MAIIPYNDSFALGKGYNSLNGKTLGSIFSVTPQTEQIAAARGQGVSFEFSVIKTAEQLYESLGVSVEVEGNVGPFFSMEGKFDFASKSSFNSQSVFYLLRVSVKNAAYHINQSSVSYNPAVLQLLKDGEAERFRRGFGDAYIEGIITGGEFFTLYEFVCSDATSHTEVKAALEISAGTFVSGVDMKASFQNTIDKVSKKSSLKIKTYMQGGIGVVLSNDINRIIDTAQNFPATVQGEGSVPYQVITASYETLPLPQGPNFVMLETQRYELVQYAKTIMEFRTKRNDLEYICMNPAEYYFEKDEAGRYKPIGQEDLAGLQQLLQQTAAYMSALTKHTVRCADNPASAGPFVPDAATPMPVFTSLPQRIQRCDFVTIFEEKDFTGKGNQLRKGKYANPSLLGLTNDQLSSIKIPPDLQVVLWEHVDFTGGQRLLRESCADLSIGTSEMPAFDNIVSAIEVYGKDEVPETHVAPPVIPAGNTPHLRAAAMKVAINPSIHAAFKKINQ